MSLCRRHLPSCSLFLLGLIGGGCSGDVPVAGPSEPTTVVSVDISPASAVLVAIGATVRLTATPQDAEGGSVSTDQPVWTSSDPSVATVTPDGDVTAVANGESVISAVVQGIQGFAFLTVRQELALIRVTPESLTLGSLGDTATLIATAYDVLDHEMASTISFTWGSSNTEVAVVSETGLVTSRANGSVQISASAEDRQGVASVAVQQSASTVAVTPASVTMTSVGETVQLEAAAYDAQGNQIASPAFSFESSHLGVASVSTDGSITAIGNGTASVRIRTVGAEASVLVTVQQALASVEVTPSFSLLAPGSTATLRARARDALGTEIPGLVFTWESTDPTIARISGGGLVTGISDGSVGIKATASGMVTTAALTVGRPTSWAAIGDWDTYQGNQQHTGFVPALLDVNDFQERWTTQVGSTSLNPPTTGDGDVFVTTFGKELTVLDGGSGLAKWTYVFDVNNSVHPPAFGGGRVYLTTGGHQDSFLWAFDPADGTVLFRSSYRNQWSSYYAPVVRDGRVYMAGGYYGGMYAFDATSGAELWFRNTNQYDKWTPAVSNGFVYAYTGSYSPNVSVVNAETGDLVFEIPDPNFSWNGWSMNIAPVLGSSNNLLATQRGRLVSFDIAGRNIGWEISSSFTGTVALAAGVIYVFNSGQLEARSEVDGTLQWVWIPPGGTPLGAPLVTENLVFVSTTSGTYAIHTGSHRSVWHHDAGGHLALSAEGFLIIAEGDGSVSAISLR